MVIFSESVTKSVTLLNISLVQRGQYCSPWINIRTLKNQSFNFRFIISAWLLALIPSAPNLFFFTTKHMETQVECVNDFDGLNMDGLIKKVYFTLVFLVIFVIPLVSWS